MSAGHGYGVAIEPSAEDPESLKNPYPRAAAMAAGISDHVWTIAEMVALLGGR